MTISKSTELKVSNETFEYAAEIASGAKDEFSRKRIYESVVCLKSLADYLKSEGYIPDINNCLYKITSLNEEIELSEFRCNGRCIDVRPVVNEKYVLIPKILFDYNILPDLFAVAKYDKKSSAVRFIGCIEPSDIVKSKQNDKYYIVDTDDLYETSEIEDCVKNVKNVKISDLNHDLYASYFIDYIDGVLSDENKKELFKHLSECKGCREKFVNFAKLENILKSAADYPQMLQDKMLNFVAATDVNSEKYKDFKEVTIEIDKEPDKYEEDDDIEVNSSDPLNVLYGNKKANDEIFNNLSSQKPKSVLDSVLAEISGHSDVSEGTDKESVESENQINPSLYKEDYSDGIVDTDNKEPQGNKESSDETKEESEDEIKEEPENESYDELEYVIKEEPENESDEEPENNQSPDNNEEFDYIQDIVSPDSDIDDDNDDDNSMFVHNIADSEQATPENASKMINDDDFIPNFSDLKKYMPTDKSEESLSVDSDEVIVIDDDEENDYEKLGKMINTSNIQDFADTENESDEILIIDENENNSEDVKEINDSDKIDVTDIDIVNENEPENEPEKEQKSVNSEDDDLVLINDEETKENEDGDDLVLINDEETKENEDGDDLVLINDEETKENEDGDDLVLINDEETKENEEDDDLVLINDEETKENEEDDDLVLINDEETKENEEDDDLVLINDEETKDDNLDLINIPGLESAELSDVDSMAKDNSLFINQVSEEVTNGINNIFPDLSDDLFNNGDNRNTELSEEDSEDEDIVFINDNNDETSNNSNSGQIEISDDVLNNMTVDDDNEQSELEDSVNEILSLNETVQQAADDVQVSDNKNDENEFVIIDDDNDFETTGTFMRPASVSDINDLPEPVSLSLRNDDEDDSEDEQDELSDLVSVDDTESENADEETSDEEENESEESEELTDTESENTDEETSDEEENESEESEELTDAESENTDEETSDEEENESEESEELTDEESENTDEETSDEEENESEDSEELTDEESENTDEETSDNEDNNSEEETDESVNQIFEDAENSENDEEDSEEHSNEIINQIFEDRNNNYENDDEEESEEADSEDEDSDDEYDDEISEDKSIFRKKVIAAVLASVLALAVSAGGIFWFVNKIKNNHQNNAEMSTSNEEQAELGSLDNNSDNTQLNENDSGLPGGMGNDENNMPNGEETNQAQPETSDNDALTLPDNANQEAADQNPSNPDLNTSVPLNISKTSWAVAPYIASDPEFKPFLQQSGHAIQAELRQKFSSVTESPNSDNVKIQITVKDNSSDGITVLKSSGSKQIDEIVLQSVKDYMANNQIPKLSDNAIQSLKKSNKDKNFKITFNVNF